MTSVDLNQTFAVEAGQVLVRRVIPRRGQAYEHACPLASFEQVAHAAEELGADGFTLDSLVEYEQKAGRYVTHTCAAVTLAFLRERGLIDVQRRRNFAADGLHLDAMVEFHALAEKTT
jgi:hypothetical protein